MAAKLLTPRQAAQILSDDGAIKESWLKDAATDGRIPHVKIAERIMFTEQHLDAIVRKFERLPRPAAAPAAHSPRPRKPAVTTAPAQAGVVRLRSNPQRAAAR